MRPTSVQCVSMSRGHVGGRDDWPDCRNIYSWMQIGNAFCSWLTGAQGIRRTHICGLPHSTKSVCSTFDCCETFELFSVDTLPIKWNVVSTKHNEIMFCIVSIVCVANSELWVSSAAIIVVRFSIVSSAFRCFHTFERTNFLRRFMTP